MHIFTEREEKEHLAAVQFRITAMITAGKRLADKRAADLLEQKTYIRDNRDEKAILHSSIVQTAGSGEAALAKAKQLGRLLQTPYFGRIDFKASDQPEALPVYIGVCTLKDPDAGTPLIYDWRSPISSMFYDYETGAASYEAPAGTIAGDISLKRQYRIKNGMMEFMIDTTAPVYDELLQRELSVSTDEKMKNIVATIQQDQHAIIRNEASPVLIIQGVAGSGKTSIALHRIAFLLYRHRDTLTSKDILIISPNKIFADYISQVLPELGEENVPETSMGLLVHEILDHQYTIGSLFEQVTALLENNNNIFTQSVHYKSGFGFLQQLNEYVVYLNNHLFQPASISVARFTIPVNVVMEQYQAYHRLPLLKRGPETAAALVKYLLYKHHYEASAKDKALLKKAVSAMLGNANSLRLYKDFFKWIGRPALFKMKGKVLEYPDAFGLAYLKICLEGIFTHRKVKHLLIDEMQDYSPVQYAVIAKLFSGKITLLGDIHQSLNPERKTDLDSLRRIFPQSCQMTLNKSYRSTLEILQVAQQIIYNPTLLPMERHGQAPTLFRATDPQEEITYIRQRITAFTQQQRYKSLAIICKTAAIAASLMETLDGLPVQLLTDTSHRFTDGVMLISAQLSKGLEFDQVIIPFVTAANYQTDIERSMLYIACTRAMHILHLTATGPIPPYLENIPS
ncbi:HelD family protein [Chitinophaga qingshengii]|uniref:DNA 3'-5' helicase n=1 Tax=Chitinophaga qingshengii TaxID=1569794 RepID=A0ABR7TPE4_9BACT|nr:UvrD-helicase domain-containing protein [Chitinophaga qingshengii]MBC9932344.1 AAA family ATPase [Chitinophaga qingshengii]